ncbi:MAG TPA: protein-disulfide reductase DsbD family protein [Candidatus Krumholzibacteria bacterium]|nr:protein-disulfide reductase DsbD family protein [Candidatus Krumholzibacteria bacterium]HPD70859.1 protein-disulfide reductase DsbD family protein [Candidatus Krumholzibacteria bacterium]HRY39441.1 protein-disulfide reductase DsbD family protein [Candidatus Krumholzibacteria bacterium]
MFVRNLAGVALLLGLCQFLPAAASRAAAASNAVTVSAQVVASADSVVVAWRFDLAERWHLYAPYCNDSGFPPSVRLDLPAGWSAGPLRWPVPERLVLPGGILDHVYHDELVLVQSLHPPRAAAGRTAIPATLSWLACRQTCVPGDTTLTLILPPADGGADAVLAAEAAIPGRLPPASARFVRGASTVRVRAPGARGLTLIPAADGPALVDLAADGTVRGDELVLRLRPGAGASAPLRGLLIIDHTNGARSSGSFVVP